MNRLKLAGIKLLVSLVRPLHRWTAVKRTLRGVLVCVREEAPADVFARVDEALAIVDAHAPWHLRALRRHVAYLGVTRLDGAYGEWQPDQRVVWLDERCHERRANAVAGTLVHEIEHVRWWRFGIGNRLEVAPDVLDRVERACDRTTIRFLERSGGDPADIAFRRGRHVDGAGAG